MIMCEEKISVCIMFEWVYIYIYIVYFIYLVLVTVFGDASQRTRSFSQTKTNNFINKNENTNNYHRKRKTESTKKNNYLRRWNHLELKQFMNAGPSYIKTMFYLKQTHVYLCKTWETCLKYVWMKSKTIVTLSGQRSKQLTFSINAKTHIS